MDIFVQADVTNSEKFMVALTAGRFKQPWSVHQLQSEVVRTDASATRRRARAAGGRNLVLDFPVGKILLTKSSSRCDVVYCRALNLPARHKRDICRTERTEKRAHRCARETPEGRKSSVV